MRWRILSACLLGLALAGCYSPKVKNGGFFCSPTDNPPCPSGFYCVNAYCVDHPGETVAGDMATSSSGADLAGVVADLASTDLASTDLAQTQYDFAQPVYDMTMCGAAGALCANGNQCCSGVCFGFLCL